LDTTIIANASDCTIEECRDDTGIDEDASRCNFQERVKCFIGVLPHFKAVVDGVLERAHADFADQAGVFVRLIEDEGEEGGEVGEDEVGFVADGGGEGVECGSSVFDVGVTEHRCEEFDGDGAEVFVVGAVGCGEDVAEGEDGDCADGGCAVVE